MYGYLIAGWVGNETEKFGRKRNREAKCKERRKNDKNGQKCAKYKKCFFFFAFEEASKFKNFLFFFSSTKKMFSFAITKCIHNALYTLHGLVFAIKKESYFKKVRSISVETTSKTSKEWVRKQKSKSGNNVKSGQKISFCGSEVKILFRCPAEKELFTTKEKNNSKKRKETRKKTQISIHRVLYKFSMSVMFKCARFK